MLVLYLAFILKASSCCCKLYILLALVLLLFGVKRAYDSGNDMFLFLFYHSFITVIYVRMLFNCFCWWIFPCGNFWKGTWPGEFSLKIKEVYMFRRNLSRVPLKILTRWLIFLTILKVSSAIKDPDVEGVVKFTVILSTPETYVLNSYNNF